MPKAPKPSPNDPIVHTEGLSKEFRGEYAVRDVTMDIGRGQIFGFIGPSGSGKTTTIRLLTGLLAPSAGKVTVLGRAPVRFRTSMREKIGYMPQLFALYPDLTVWENLNFAASIYGMGLFRGKRLHEQLKFVGLDEHRNKLARNISGGMQRRLSLAATLLHTPELIFLDEPTAGIDPILRSKFWERFRALRDEGRTLFVTTQYVGEAANCDRIGVMAEGELVVVDTPDNLRRQAFGGEVIDLKTEQRLEYDHIQQLRQLPGIHRNIVRTGDQEVRIVADDAATAIPELMEWCQSRNLQVESIQQFQPPFDDVFVELLNRKQRAAQAVATTGGTA